MDNIHNSNEGERQGLLAGSSQQACVDYQSATTTTDVSLVVVVPDQRCNDPSSHVEEDRWQLPLVMSQQQQQQQQRRRRRPSSVWRRISNQRVASLVLFVAGVILIGCTYMVHDSSGSSSNNDNHKDKKAAEWTTRPLLSWAISIPFVTPSTFNTVADDPPPQSTVIVNDDDDDDASSSQQHSNQNQNDPSSPQMMIHRIYTKCGIQRRVVVSNATRHFPSYQIHSTAKRGASGDLGGTPLVVSHDGRSLLLNHKRALFLSGSLHPVRSTWETWNMALDEAVAMGLNMITIYTVWSHHQPLLSPDDPNVPGPINWSLPTSKNIPTTTNNHNDNHTTDEAEECQDDEVVDGKWELADAIREAGKRGLFVHIRVGPYICAEYSYGGIPSWVPLVTWGNNTNTNTSSSSSSLPFTSDNHVMSMRRLNAPWMQATTLWVKAITSYISQHNLWAHQGGPIVLGQIENEIGNETLPTGTMQGYANWVGQLAQTLEPNVTWTMCNGLTSPNAIHTCNGAGSECSKDWLEQGGQTGRIQVDQPALWSEHEMGYQIWGDDPNHASDYFSGRTARSVARHALRWFARGGSHMNYYMFWGGYNRGAMAATGITNKYAAGAPLCPSGQRHQPMFDHLTTLHTLLSHELATILLHQPSAMNNNYANRTMNDIRVKTPKGWALATKQRAILYQHAGKTVMFVENDATEDAFIQLPQGNNGISTSVMQLDMVAESVIVVINGVARYDSGRVDPKALTYSRKIISLPRKRTPEQRHLLDSWYYWPEVIGAKIGPDTTVSIRPLEQTEMTVASREVTDSAWYETAFAVNEDMVNASLAIETTQGCAMSVYVDYRFVGSANHHSHTEGPVVLHVDMGDIALGVHTVAILSETLGYFNLIGRWGASTTAKVKGITGAVNLTGITDYGVFHTNLITGPRSWQSSAGLNGQTNLESVLSSIRSQPDRLLPEVTSFKRTNNDAAPSSSSSSYFGTKPGMTKPATWAMTTFTTPSYDPTERSLMVDITSGRGRLWLNGHDLGRFWNITQSKTNESSPSSEIVYSQRYYFLPPDFLFSDDQRPNEILLFNALEGNLSSINLVLTSIVQGEQGTLNDDIGDPMSCL